ncbi:DUF6207 family protein [Streptomyces viridochromogenes]|uniref:DUF6207 family protein n=1 Tax=Streptomyces viridochromogenes TaxID=1938 RepID=UPI001F4281B1|nr:DUF6207 family protein [Streptomyces viridochromogenes]
MLRSRVWLVEIAACDEETAFAVQQLLAARCAIAPADRTTREPGEPGCGCAASWTCVRRPTSRCRVPSTPSHKGSLTGRDVPAGCTDQLLLASRLRHDHARTPVPATLRDAAVAGRCRKWWWMMRAVAILTGWRKQKTG